jgi:hypothetical protein
LSIPNQEIQAPKCFKITFAQKVLEFGTFQILDLQISDAGPILRKHTARSGGSRL